MRSLFSHFFTVFLCASSVLIADSSADSEVPTFIDARFFEGSTSNLELEIRDGRIVAVIEKGEAVLSLEDGYFVEEIVVDEDGDGMLLMVYNSDAYRPYAYSVLLKRISKNGNQRWSIQKKVLLADDILPEVRSWVDDIIFLSNDETYAILRIARTVESNVTEVRYIKYSTEFWDIDSSSLQRTVKNLKFF
jgi:hypothetical protein